jgi:hypothetical protein
VYNDYIWVATWLGISGEIPMELEIEIILRSPNFLLVR